MMVKKILKYLLYGISWGWGWLIVICLIADLIGRQEVLDAVFRNFSGQVLAASLTGIACGSVSMVYTFERLRRWQQIAIHYCTGLGTFIPVAFWIGWFPAGSAAVAISCVLISSLIFFIIWLGFFLYNRWEAQKINERLKAQDMENESDTRPR